TPSLRFHGGSRRSRRHEVEDCHVARKPSPGSLGTLLAQQLFGTMDVARPRIRRMTDLLRESDVQLAIRRLLESVGYWTYALSQGRQTRQSAGLPDLYALHPRKGAVWI